MGVFYYGRWYNRQKMEHMLTKEAMPCVYSEEAYQAQLEEYQEMPWDELRSRFIDYIQECEREEY